MRVGRIWVLLFLFGFAGVAYTRPNGIVWYILLSITILAAVYGYRFLKGPKREIDQAEVERHQNALDRYLERNLSEVEIGRFYERQIGYLLECDGYDVTFHGALRGFNDQGIDLIAGKNKETLIIQAKCWSKSRVIDETLILKLFVSAYRYRRANSNKKNIKAVFYSTTDVSNLAREVAELLSVEIRNKELDKSYPLIKCNVTANNERIFHLPFDHYYDQVRIKRGSNEFYAKTVAEAVSKGFRRAYRNRRAKSA